MDELKSKNEQMFYELKIGKNGTRSRTLKAYPEWYWKDNRIPHDLKKLDWFSKHYVEPPYIKCG
jgi:hypothetical protein